jgi:hypothetical protein
LRERYHDIWEYTHRFVGWFVVADLVTHLALKAFTLSNPRDLFRTILPYLAIVCIISIFYVWFTVRRTKVTVNANHSVAIVKFKGLPTLNDGTFARISRNGLEWHAFSVATTDFEKREFSLIVGRAGDWTTKLIHDSVAREAPERLYIRGVNPPGFMHMHHSYKKGTPIYLIELSFTHAFVAVVTICTGAGIAPALPHIAQKTSDIFLVWIGKVRLSRYAYCRTRLTNVGSIRITRKHTERKFGIPSRPICHQTKCFCTILLFPGDLISRLSLKKFQSNMKQRRSSLW